MFLPFFIVLWRLNGTVQVKFLAQCLALNNTFHYYSIFFFKLFCSWPFLKRYLKLMKYFIKHDVIYSSQKLNEIVLQQSHLIKEETEPKRSTASREHSCISIQVAGCWLLMFCIYMLQPHHLWILTRQATYCNKYWSTLKI